MVKIREAIWKTLATNMAQPQQLMSLKNTISECQPYLNNGNITERTAFVSLLHLANKEYLHLESNMEGHDINVARHQQAYG